ncbi:MAG: ectoine/hydroxyectoine ABC transporter ATP-binding protein EhuA [Verrucomicrobia bacterium]|nr:ectoine/hydroxyectoine ABC transporter ATP-binding protein EhuA [Verrucomicrobiota bacterium]
MTDSPEPFIQIRDLHKSFGDLKVLQGINLDIPAGEMVSVIGPSGSGKSTLLRVLMTLERPEQGEVLIGGEPLYSMDGEGHTTLPPKAQFRALRNRIGMVFQHFNLFPHMTVLRNVTEAPVRVLGVSRKDAKAEAMKYLDEVGLAEKADAYPAQLSGGQKQRVAIARALAMHPEIMLFDEITSALDPELVGGILALLDRLGKRKEMTMLIVTHHMNFARQSSDRVLFFDGGVILEDGKPDDIFTHPTHDRTREFLKSVLEV